MPEANQNEVNPDDALTEIIGELLRERPIAYLRKFIEQMETLNANMARIRRSAEHIERLNVNLAEIRQTAQKIEASIRAIFWLVVIIAGVFVGLSLHLRYGW